MAITKFFTGKISDKDRIQIRNESNFSFDVLKELIKLRPIEVNAKVENGSIEVNISMTEGFVANVLPESDNKLPYFADIDHINYQRLNVDVDETERTWFLVFDEKCGSGLDHIATQPIVIKGFERPGKGYTLIFAANGAFRIVRCTDKRVSNVVNEPAEIPEALLRLVEIIDEPLPEKRVSLELLKERARTTKRMLELYLHKQFQLSVKEEIALSVAELDDYIGKVDARIEDLRFSKDGVEAMIFMKMSQRMRQVMGSKKFENAMSGIYREVRAELLEKEKYERFLTQGNVYENLLSKLENFGVHEDVLRLLNSGLHGGFFAHSCVKCGGDAVVRKEGAKFSVKCRSCDNALGDNHCSRSRVMSIGNWNKINDNVEREAWITYIGINVDRENELEFKLKKIVQTLMAMIKYWRDTLPNDMKVREEFGVMQETLEMVKFIKSKI